MSIGESLTAQLQGTFLAMLSESMASGKISETILDNAKKTAEKFVESQIDSSNYSEEEKEMMKSDHKQWAESVKKGIKHRLRESGKLLK